MENTEQTAKIEAMTETKEHGKKAPSPKKEEANGKIGPNGYNRSVENIRHDLDRLGDRLGEEHRKLREDIQRTLSLVEQVLPGSSPGDLAAFVDRGLSDPGRKQPALPDRNEIARTWEEGKRTVEELDAFYSRLRTQKIWSQEDLEGILTRLESVAGEIAEKAGDHQRLVSELDSSPPDKDPERQAEELRTTVSGELSGLREQIEESRRAILEAIAARAADPRPFDVLAPLLQKIGDLEERIKEQSPSASLESSHSAGSGRGSTTLPPLPDRELRTSLFSKRDTEGAKPPGNPVATPRIKRMGFVFALTVLSIVAIVARERHAGPPPGLTKPVANRETIPPLPASPFPPPRLSAAAPTFQNFEPVLTGLDRLHAKESQNGQAIADLSGKIDRALANITITKEKRLSGQEKRLIEEGRELEWLVKTWPAGPGRKELLRMMGSYAGE